MKDICKTREEALEKWPEISWTETKVISKDKKYGKLTPVYKTLDNKGTTKRYTVVLQCDCGNYIKRGAQQIVKPKKYEQSCGECDILGRGRDLTGMKFGRLTALKPVGRNKERYIIWECECECIDKNTGKHTIKNVSSDNLINGNTKSCGCWNKDSAKIVANKYLTIDMLGKKYGHWTVIEKVENNKDGAYWLCECDCQNKTRHIIKGDALRNGRSLSCGCRLISRGELRISEILNANNIKYETQKMFEECKFPNTNKLARFDFFVNDSYLIEFDGEQHFKDAVIGWGDKLEAIQYRDNFKNQWAKENNIPIIRIPYWHYNSLRLEDLQLETSKFIIR